MSSVAGRAFVMRKSPDLDSTRGCLVGLAVGNALGAPLEGVTSRKIEATYGVVRDYVDGVRAWRRKPDRWRLPGLHADDGQQALALADVIIDRGRVSSRDLADRLLALEAACPDHYGGAFRSIGRSLKATLTDLANGVPPSLSGQVSAGTSASARAVPLAIRLAHRLNPPPATESVSTSEFVARANAEAESRSDCDDQDVRPSLWNPLDAEALEDLLAATLPTHRDIRALAGAAAVVSALVRVLRGEPSTASLIFRVAADTRDAENLIAARYGDTLHGVAHHRHAVSTALAAAEAALDHLTRGKSYRHLTRQAGRHGADKAFHHPTIGFAPALVPTCLYLFVKSQSFGDALMSLMRLGGDTDTAGAILGALSGARDGRSGIPDHWLEGLRDTRGFDLRARALAGRLESTATIPDLVATEKMHTEQERFYRADLLTRHGVIRGQSYPTRARGNGDHPGRGREGRNARLS